MSSVSYEIPHTSDIPFFSSLHGRAQREVRGIEKRDLQAAVKYGRKEWASCNRKTGAIRWKYTYANLVYITDGTSTIEITSYAENQSIPRAELSLEHILEHNAARERLAMNPSLCTSHTVIVVDHSASMRTSDVADFRNRAKAVFGMLALEFVAKQRLTGEATSSDVVSLLLMHDGVDVIFEREPMGLVLYNKFAGMHDMVSPRSHGNFLPSLDIAEELFKVDAAQSGGGCALCLLFLSDGKPSDNATGILRTSNRGTARAISDRVSLLAAAFPHRLSVATLGFASNQQDFSVLETMAEAARNAGAKGAFHRPELSAAGLGSAIANSVSSLTATKTKLTTLMAPLPAAERRQLPVLREVERERAGGSRWSLAPVTSQLRDEWVPYMDSVERFEYRPESIGVLDVHPWVATGLFSNRADGIVIRRKAFAEGAERLVFGLQEYDSRADELVGPELVAKESKYEGRHGKTSFDHAASSLAEATRSATAFNLSVKTHLSLHDESNLRVDRRVWEISFLGCSLYTYMEGGVKRELLAEKRLLPAGRYTKWNGNNGYVFRGRGRKAPTPSSRPATVDVIKPFEEESVGPDLPDGVGGYDSDGVCSVGSAELDEEVDYGAGAEAYNRKRNREETPSVFEPRPADYLQAFSHFSYWNSGRKMLVCDLQGVMTDGPFEDDNRAGVFELTDPVVHYKSQSGRKQVFGRTDLGKKGMHRFFQTHDCNAVCRLLGLPGCRSPAAAEAARAGAGAGEGVVQPFAPPKRQRVAGRIVLAS